MRLFTGDEIRRAILAAPAATPADRLSPADEEQIRQIVRRWLAVETGVEDPEWFIPGSSLPSPYHSIRIVMNPENPEERRIEGVRRLRARIGSLYPGGAGVPERRRLKLLALAEADQRGIGLRQHEEEMADTAVTDAALVVGRAAGIGTDPYDSRAIELPAGGGQKAATFEIAEYGSGAPAWSYLIRHLAMKSFEEHLGARDLADRRRVGASELLDLPDDKHALVDARERVDQVEAIEEFFRNGRVTAAQLDLVLTALREETDTLEDAARLLGKAASTARVQAKGIRERVSAEEIKKALRA